MDYETLRWEVRGEGALTLSCPDHLNAFSVTMARELEDAFRKVRQDNEVRLTQEILDRIDQLVPSSDFPGGGRVSRAGQSERSGARRGRHRRQGWWAEPGRGRAFGRLADGVGQRPDPGHRELHVVYEATPL
ncbi:MULTISPECIES: hypothetical protein [Streptomyces]|uniref:hypothetical protein n=1 Tax=Streptomyces TaxID=1883 RepID=UPI0034092F4D